MLPICLAMGVAGNLIYQLAMKRQPLGANVFALLARVYFIAIGFAVTAYLVIPALGGTGPRASRVNGYGFSLWSAPIAVGIFLVELAYAQAGSKGLDMSLFAPLLVGSAVPFSALLLIVCFGETISGWKALGIALCIAGSMTLTNSRHSPRQLDRSGAYKDKRGDQWGPSRTVYVMSAGLESPLYRCLALGVPGLVIYQLFAPLLFGCVAPAGAFLFIFGFKEDHSHLKLIGIMLAVIGVVVLKTV